MPLYVTVVQPWGVRPDGSVVVIHRFRLAQYDCNGKRMTEACKRHKKRRRTCKCSDGVGRRRFVLRMRGVR